MKCRQLQMRAFSRQGHETGLQPFFRACKTSSTRFGDYFPTPKGVHELPRSLLSLMARSTDPIYRTRYFRYPSYLFRPILHLKPQTTINSVPPPLGDPLDLLVLSFQAASTMTPLPSPADTDPLIPSVSTVSNERGVLLPGRSTS